jgi:ankyrin repeat protein
VYTEFYCAEKGGADVKSEDNNGQTAMYWAVKYDHLAVVEWLVKRIRVNHKDKEGKRALHWATESNNLAMVQWLVTHGHADVNRKDNQGMTVLNFAAMQGFHDIAKFLVSSKL